MLSEQANTLGLIAFVGAVVLVGATFVRSAVDEVARSHNRSLMLLGLGMAFGNLRSLWRTMPENIELGFAVASLAMVGAAIWIRLRAHHTP